MMASCRVVARGRENGGNFPNTKNLHKKFQIKQAFAQAKQGYFSANQRNLSYFSFERTWSEQYGL